LKARFRLKACGESDKHDFYWRYCHDSLECLVAIATCFCDCTSPHVPGNPKIYRRVASYEHEHEVNFNMKRTCHQMLSNNTDKQGPCQTQTRKYGLSGTLEVERTLYLVISARIGLSDLVFSCWPLYYKAQARLLGLALATPMLWRSVVSTVMFARYC
jgi:hypothetical protein